MCSANVRLEAYCRFVTREQALAGPLLKIRTATNAVSKSRPPPPCARESAHSPSAHASQRIGDEERWARAWENRMRVALGGKYVGGRGWERMPWAEVGVEQAKREG